MFQDYYAILEVQPPVSDEVLKMSYHKQCLKWHPDKNPAIDTTRKMQEVIEAYIFLKDEEARQRYDNAYEEFKRYQEQEKAEPVTQATNPSSKEQSSEGNGNRFEVKDEVLKKWMMNAQEQAKKILADVVDEFKGASAQAGKSILNQIIFYLLPMFMGFLFFRACQHR